MPIRDTFTITMVLVAVGSTNAWGAQALDPRWVPVARTPDVAIYVDRQRARVLDKVVVEVWMLWEFTDTQVNEEKKFNRMVTLVQLDCKRTQSMQIESNFYFNDEFVLREATPEVFREWVPEPPQSVAETLNTNACLIAHGRPIEPLDIPEQPYPMR